MLEALRESGRTSSLLSTSGQQEPSASHLLTFPPKRTSSDLLLFSKRQAHWPRMEGALVRALPDSPLPPYPLVKKSRPSPILNFDLPNNHISQLYIWNYPVSAHNYVNINCQATLLTGVESNPGVCTRNFSQRLPLGSGVRGGGLSRLLVFISMLKIFL